MNHAAFSELTSSMDMRVVNKIAYGVIASWPVTLYENDLLTVSIARPDSAMLKEFKKKCPWAKQVRVSASGIQMKIHYRKYDGSKAVCLILTISTLQKCGAVLLDQCPYCKGFGCDSLIPHSDNGIGYNRRVHQHCLQESAYRLQEDAERNRENGSYITGIIGGFLGMIIGTIPSILTIYYMERIYAVLFALIPLGAYYGYRLLRGRMNKFALVVSILMAILGVVFMNLVFECIFTMKYYGMDLLETLQLIPYLLIDSAFLQNLLTNSYQEFLFSGLGVFFSWQLISQTASGNAANASQLLSLAVPYPKAPGDYYYRDFDAETESSSEILP